MVLRIKPIALSELPDLDVGGQPRLVPLDSIDEDPEQPRKEFDDDSLGELAETLRLRGVRSPVSVRPHPAELGRWMLNFGARRLRASKLAGKSDIPAFVDETFDGYDQVIENEQREGLKPLEIALFIKRQLDRGQSRKDIARGIGKSPSYITVASALIDAPDWLMDAYRTGKCRGMFELYELRRLHEEDAAAVQAWLAGVDLVGRVELRRLKERVSGAEGLAAASEGRAVAGASREVEAAPAGRSSAARSAVDPLAPLSREPKASVVASRFQPFKSDERSAAPVGLSVSERLFVEAEHEGRRVRVMLDELPLAPASVYVVAEDAGRVVASVHALGGLELVRGTGPRP